MLQARSWRSSKAVAGAGQTLALVTICIVLSDGLAYAFLGLAQAGWVPDFVGKFPMTCAYVWFTLAPWPIFVLGIVELVLVLELPALRKCRTPVHIMHVGAFGACVVWLVAMVHLAGMSGK